MESSYPYSPPQSPGLRALEDMIIWFATPEIRRELTDPGSDLMGELVEQTTRRLAQWRPTSELQHRYFRHGRVLDWIVWSTVSSADPSMVAAYADPDDCLEPWSIEIETLPKYPGLPTAMIKPEPPTESDPRVIVLPSADLLPDRGDR